jgi:hypothetical protein
MKQVTAVEWLVEQLNEKIDFIPMQKWDMIRDIVQQAKAMEKEQIKSAYERAINNYGMPPLEQFKQDNL